MARGECYRSSIFDPDSIKRYNPIIKSPRADITIEKYGSDGIQEEFGPIPHNLEGTYEEWSKCQLEWNRLHLQNDNIPWKKTTKKPGRPK